MFNRSSFDLHHHKPKRRLIGAAALVVAASSTFVPAAFGAKANVHATHATSSFPVTVATTSGKVTIPTQPTRIISLSPTATEMLFALGAGPRVVAVDADSDYPANAPKTALSGLTPNVEAIAKYKPNLVIVSYLPSTGGFAAGLAALHIPLLVEDAAANLSDTYSQITALGQATGRSLAATHLVTGMKAQIAAAVKAAPKFSPALSYYFEVDNTYYSETSSTFIGQIMSLFGLKNIADKASGAAASGGYPQLSSEFIVKSNPSLIFLADTVCCHQSFTTVSTRAGWKTMTAVKTKSVIALNDDVASRWGPRVVELAQDIEKALVAQHNRLEN